ncbi:hypothetical protein D3C81_1801970 [compost metagenome]
MVAIGNPDPDLQVFVGVEDLEPGQGVKEVPEFDLTAAIAAIVDQVAFAIRFSQLHGLFAVRDHFLVMDDHVRRSDELSRGRTLPVLATGLVQHEVRVIEGVVVLRKCPCRPEGIHIDLQRLQVIDQ